LTAVAFYLDPCNSCWYWCLVIPPAGNVTAANLERCGPSLDRQRELCRTLLAKLQKLVTTARTEGNDRARSPETDFHAAAQGASGPEFGATDYLQTTSSLAFERLLALNFTLRVFRSISCRADRKQAKDVLRQQLFDTASKFENDGDRITQILTFIEVPATAQLGLKLKDDMQATKDRLDKIATLLDSSK
jgi:hypothetical protein